MRLGNRSMIKDATDKHISIRIVVFDSNRNEQNILYKKEFDDWAAKDDNLKVVYTITDEAPTTWIGEKGRISREMLQKHLGSKEIADSIFYICGPPGMLGAMQDLLQKDMQIPKERIRIEEFMWY